MLLLKMFRSRRVLTNNFNANKECALTEDFGIYMPVLTIRQQPIFIRYNSPKIHVIYSLDITDVNV